MCRWRLNTVSDANDTSDGPNGQIFTENSKKYPKWAWVAVFGRFEPDHFFVTWTVLVAYITVFFDSKWFLMVLWGLKNVF